MVFGFSSALSGAGSSASSSGPTLGQLAAPFPQFTVTFVKNVFNWKIIAKELSISRGTFVYGHLQVWWPLSINSQKEKTINHTWVFAGFIGLFLVKTFDSAAALQLSL